MTRRKKLLVEQEYINLEPGQSRPRAWHGTEGKNDDRRSDYHQALGFGQKLNKPVHQKQNDRHRTGKNNFLGKWYGKRSHTHRKDNEDETANQDSPIDVCFGWLWALSSIVMPRAIKSAALRREMNIARRTPRTETAGMINA